MPERPAYNVLRSYEWNYRQAPRAEPVAVPAWPGQWDYCGWPLSAPLAVAAGPLLNGQWLTYYAALGFDALTYKTVRSRAHDCYPLPNLQPVHCSRLDQDDQVLPAALKMEGSWAVSFGMPSRPPSVWQADLRATRAVLSAAKALAVSVVATPEASWNWSQVADDYAQCSQWAVAAGADMVELNLSCPNVTSCDGRLYRQPEAARTVVRRARERIGDTPLLLKIGHLTEPRAIDALVDACSDGANALVMVNCVPARVQFDGRLMFGGAARGVAGTAIHEAAVRQVDNFRQAVDRQGSRLQLVGCGGVFRLQDVERFLAAGASCVQLATAAMLDPEVAMRIRQQANL
jgi:dihydroorotate dehydrogenase